MHDDAVECMITSTMIGTRWRLVKCGLGMTPIGMLYMPGNSSELKEGDKQSDVISSSH